jgi:hypothetical protein
VSLYAINLVLRSGELEASTTPWGPLLLSLVGLGALLFSGYLGGLLVYQDGIAAGRALGVSR